MMRALHALDHQIKNKETMRIYSFALLLTCLFSCISVIGTPKITEAKNIKRLFIVHSYEDGHICGQPQHDGALKVLATAGWEQGSNLEVGVYHMDTKRKNNTPHSISQQARKAQKAIEDFQPDVVLTLDDNAFRTIALPASGSATQYVFSGLNGQPEMYDKRINFMKNRSKPGYNITGVYEKLYIREAIKVLSNMYNMDTVLFLGDESPTGKAINKQVKLELAVNNDLQPLPCKIKQRTIHTWEEFTETINSTNEDPTIDAFYLGTLLLKDSEGKTYTAPDIIEYTLSHANKPAIGLNYAFIKLGLYGGATVDFFAMGQLAGQKIAKIFNGEKAGNISIEDAPRVALVFNLQRAEELGMVIPADILMAADEVFRK
jgi:ABC-type uncharacterized transport system substrate-binding protein